MLVLILALGTAAGAQEDIFPTAAPEESRRMMTLTGSVVAGETKAALAPFGGLVQDVSLKPGDIVSPGDTLFTIETTKVYAPCDGTVGSVRAMVGDESKIVQGRYGALLYIEPSSRFVLDTDTKLAYNENDNKMVHVGETVYIGSRTSNDRVGKGFVTSVEGETYSVEVTEGNLILDEGVSIYRQSDFAASSRIGSGTTAASKNVAITAEGSIFRLHVAQGDTVKRGDVLMEMVDGSIGYNPFPTNVVVSDAAAIVASVDVAAGTSVSKSQTMATLYPLDRLEIAVPVTEWDLKNIQVGDTVRVELLGFYGLEPATGTVAAISGLDSGETEVAYTARIEFEASDGVRIGMSATIYINND